MRGEVLNGDRNTGIIIPKSRYITTVELCLKTFHNRIFCHYPHVAHGVHCLQGVHCALCTA